MRPKVATTPPNNPPPAKPRPQDEKRARKQAASDDALLREIDDAVRQDDLSKFGRKYGIVVGFGLLAALLAFGGYLFWQNSQEDAMERDSETLVTAMDQLEAGNLATASQNVQALAEGDRPGARSLARMMQAGIALEEGKSQQASELFAAVAGDGDAPAEMRDLARIRQVAAVYDSMEPSEVVRILSGVANPDSPFFGSAGEMVAMAHLKLGNRDEAGQLFSQIAKADDVPETLRSRSRQMAGLLGVDAIANPQDILDAQEAAPSAPQ